MLLKHIDKEYEKKINDTKKLNNLVKKYNRAVEIGSKEHHQLVVKLSESYRQVNNRSCLNKNYKNILKSKFKKIKKWRVFKMFNNQKFKSLTKDQKEQVNEAAKKYEEAYAATKTRKVYGPSKEVSERFHEATKEYADVLSKFGLNHR